MIFAVSLGSLIGVTLLHFYSAWPPSFLIKLLFSIVAFLSLILYFVSKLSLYRNAIIFLLSVCIGWGWAYYQVFQRIAQKQIIEVLSQGVISGTVIGITQHTDSRVQFDLQTNPKSIWKIRLYWQSPSAVLHDGDKISVEAKLKRPWGVANPGGFDQEKQLFIDNIAATGQVVRLVEYLPCERLSVSYLRQKINERITHILGDGSLVGVIQAITVGIRSDISMDEWRVFQATGTSHVVAISGLHIGLVAVLCANIMSFCVRRSYFLTSLLPAQCYGAIFGAIGATIYSAAAGFSIPTQRACIMVIVAMFACLRRQPILSWQTLAFAWIAIGLYDPFTPLQMGFWLSFGCVVALIMGQSHYQSETPLRRWIMPQCVVFIALMPLGVLFFHQIPLLSPVANMFFLPIISFIIVPFSLLGAIGLPFCLEIAYKALTLSWPILNKLATTSFSVLQLPHVSFIAIVLGCLGVIVLMLPRGTPARRLGWCSLLPILFIHTETLPTGSFKFTLLDVGQGLASVIQTKHHTLIYDTGPTYGEQSDAGQRIIVPFLKTLRIKRLDKIIISHSDLDHRGGLNTLYQYPHDEIITSEPHRLKQLATKCLPGQEWEWDGVHFIFINPIVEHKKRNNVSCVLKVTANGKSVLLTGDIEQYAEGEIIKQFEDLLKSDVLLVPHHGSLTSSSQGFIDAVSPQYALFPVGKNNRYQFPRLEILQRYQASGIKSLLAWQTGAIIFYFGGEDDLTPPILWRDTFNHYWNPLSTSGE